MPKAVPARITPGLTTSSVSALWGMSRKVHVEPPSLDTASSPWVIPLELEVYTVPGDAGSMATALKVKEWPAGLVSCVQERPPSDVLARKSPFVKEIA